LVTELLLAPHATHDLYEFSSAFVTLIVRNPLAAVFPHLLLPPGRNDVQAEPSAGYLIDVGSHLCRHRWQPEPGPYCIHKLEFRGHRRQGGGGCPAFQNRGCSAFDVIEIQFRQQRYIESNLLSSLCNSLVVVECGFHLLVVYVAKPAAE